MKTSIAIRIPIVVGLISLVGNSSGCGPGGHAKPTSDVKSTTRTVDQSLDEVSTSFKAHSDTCLRLKEGEILFKQLKSGMSRQEVNQLLGEPDTKHSKKKFWFYNIWYSRFIGVEFDGDKVIQITGG